MSRWKLTTAAALATLMIAGPAFGQTTSGSSATGGSGAPRGSAATGSEAKGEQTKSSGAESDTMKSSAGTKSSDTMKSDKGTSGGMRAGRAGGMAAGNDKVKAVQQALTDKGHDPGEADGKMGPRTQAALRDFQKAQGMPATGRVDAKTMQALGIDGGKTSSAGQTSTSGSASPGAAGATGSGSAAGSGAASGSSTGSSAPAASGATDAKNSEGKK